MTLIASFILLLLFLIATGIAAFREVVILDKEMQELERVIKEKRGKKFN